MSNDSTSMPNFNEMKKRVTSKGKAHFYFKRDKLGTDVYYMEPMTPKKYLEKIGIVIEPEEKKKKDESLGRPNISKLMRKRWLMEEQKEGRI